MEAGLKTKLIAALTETAMFSERLIRSHREVDFVNVKSVLILEYRLPLGCCVHLTPLYVAIKDGRPKVEVTVATFGLAAKVLRHHLCIDHLIETPDTLSDTLGAAQELRIQLKSRKIRPDAVLTGASDSRTRISLLGMLGCRGWRGGFTLLPRLYQRSLEYDKNLSLIDNNLRLASLTGADSRHREPSVFFSERDLAEAAKLVCEANPSNKPLLVMVTQGSGGQSTGWHRERFAEVARRAAEEHELAVVYVGTAGDVGAVEELRVAAGVGVSLAGKTSVTQLAALLAMSDYLVSLDTGTMHLGRAVGVPFVVLGPSWQKPLEWLPLGLPQARIVRGADRDDVPPGYRLDEVTVPDVLEALRDLISIYPPSKEAGKARIAKGLSTVDHLAPSASTPSLGRN